MDATLILIDSDGELVRARALPASLATPCSWLEGNAMVSSPERRP